MAKIDKMQQAKILTDEWLYKLGLGDWDITANVVDELQGGNDDDIAARCWPKWQYKQALIEIKRSEVERCTKKQIERIVVHEFCHCLINEMLACPTDPEHEERVVTELTDAFIWTKEGRKNNGRS